LAISEGLSRKGAVALMSLSVVVIVYPLSWIIFKYVEQPGISLGKRLTGSRTGSRGPVEVEIASRSVAQKPPSMSRSLKSKEGFVSIGDPTCGPLFRENRGYRRTERSLSD
jgi:hypothetical protein